MSELAKRALMARVERMARASSDPDSFHAASATLIHACTNSYGAKWVALHPDETTWPGEAFACCTSAALRGPEHCLCWEPVFDGEQADPQPFADADIATQPRMCADCAFRKGSPERADPYEEEELLGLVDRGELFWCHAGIRRPIAYRHPALGDIPADPSDYQPLIDQARGVPIQADGSPAILCAGWAARAERAMA